MYIQRNRWRLSRRTFLQAAGVSLALPWLEAMGLRSGSVTNAGEMAGSEIPRRAYFSHWGFFNNRYGIPKSTGRNYALTSSLKSLEPYKDDFTLLSGLRTSAAGHGRCGCLLTGINTPQNGMRAISVDQQIAAFHHGKTRVPSLVLGITRSTGFGGPFHSTLSWTANRTPIAPENRPEVVFERLFRAQDKKTLATKRIQMDRKASILDKVRSQARDLETKLGKSDRATLDQYFTSIRDLEERLQVDRAWLDKPVQKVDPLDARKIAASLRPQTNDDGTCMKQYLRLFFDVIALAFQTDSTRVVAHYPKGEDGPVFKDRTKCPYDYHTLSHHNEDAEKLRLWAEVDAVYMEHWAYFLGKLKGIKEGQGTLLDHSMIAWATHQGEGGHAGNNLPLILAGGAGLGIKHQGHLVKKDLWVGSVWQTMVDRIGMPLPTHFQAGHTDGVIQEIV